MLVQGSIVQGEGSTVLVKSLHTPTSAPSTSQPHFSPTLRIPIRQETKVPQPSSPPHTNVADKVASTGVDVRHKETWSRQYRAAYTKLIRKVKKLVTKDKLRKSRRKLRLVLLDEEALDTDNLTPEDPSKQRRKIAQINEDGGITLVQMGAQTQGSPKVKTAGVSVNDTAAETLVYIRRSEAKTKDKGKGIMEESESPMIKTKRQQEQERLGLEAAVKLQDEARVEADEELVQRLQTEEREKYSEDEQGRMLVDLINQRKRYFAAQKAEAKRNKPMTQAQQRIYMTKYIKHMTNYKLWLLKKLSFDEINDLFKTTIRRVNTFVPMETDVRKGVQELVADSSQAAIREARGSKRAVKEELGHQSSKKQKSDELSQEELHQLIIIVPEEGMNIEALQTKYPIID
nr:hypothetical protein [Tanacetum cinerariifolium]